MLTVHRLTGKRATRTVSYFTEDEAGYYASSDGEQATTPGRWMGRLAANIGLAGKVTLEEFLRVLDGRDPRTGKPWVPRRKDHAAGVEIAASAPKSVSVVGVLSSAETSAVVQEALDLGAEVVLDYIVEHVKLVRRGRNGTIVETARELLAVAFDHETSRQTKQQAALGIPADPGKHKHIVMPVARRHDGRLAAIDYRALKIRRQELEAVHHAAIATALAKHGLASSARRAAGSDSRLRGSRARCARTGAAGRTRFRSTAPRRSQSFARRTAGIRRTRNCATSTCAARCRRAAPLATLRGSGGRSARSTGHRADDRGAPPRRRSPLPR